MDLYNRLLNTEFLGINTQKDFKNLMSMFIESEFLKKKNETILSAQSIITSSKESQELHLFFQEEQPFYYLQDTRDPDTRTREQGMKFLEKSDISHQRTHVDNNSVLRIEDESFLSLNIEEVEALKKIEQIPHIMPALSKAYFREKRAKTLYKKLKDQISAQESVRLGFGVITLILIGWTYFMFPLTIRENSNFGNIMTFIALTGLLLTPLFLMLFYDYKYFKNRNNHSRSHISFIELYLYTGYRRPKDLMRRLNSVPHEIETNVQFWSKDIDEQRDLQNLSRWLIFQQTQLSGEAVETVDPDAPIRESLKEYQEQLEYILEKVDDLKIRQEGKLILEDLVNTRTKYQESIDWNREMERVTGETKSYLSQVKKRV